MRLITSNPALGKELARLIDQYANMAFAVAWASALTDEPEILADIVGQPSELQWILSRYLRVAERFYPQLKLMELQGRNLFF